MAKSEKVTLGLPKDMLEHLHAKVVRKIRQGEDEPRASVTEEIRALIRADMERADA